MSEVETMITQDDSNIEVVIPEGKAKQPEPSKTVTHSYTMKGAIQNAVKEQITRALQTYGLK